MVKPIQLNVLKELADKLNALHIRWSLGASMMLYFKGLKVEPDDIDIIVNRDDFDKLQTLLKEYKYTYQEPNKMYKTKHFYSLEIQGIDIDIMIDFIIKTTSEMYYYPFHIDESIDVGGSMVHLASINEWRTAYKMIGRTKKVEIIDAFLQNKKV